VAQHTPDFRLQIVGSNHWDRFELDGYQRELKELAQALERAGVEVKFLGHVGRDALPDAFRAAHIHVVPSRWDEPFGLTTLEGMACGLCLVASRTGGTPEVVGDAGLLFERDSVNDLAAQLTRLMQDSHVRREFSLQARKRAEEFAWSRTWQRLKNLTAI
jgi:glycosyltransferase involved in cell wall biosynthesis